MRIDKQLPTPVAIALNTLPFVAIVQRYTTGLPVFSSKYDRVQKMLLQLTNSWGIITKIEIGWELIFNLFVYTVKSEVLGRMAELKALHNPAGSTIHSSPCGEWVTYKEYVSTAAEAERN